MSEEKVSQTINNSVLGVSTMFGIRYPVMLTTEDLSLISSTATRTALRETIAYLTHESFEELLAKNNAEIISAFQKVLSDHEKEMRDRERDLKRNIIKNTELLLTNYRKCKEMVRQINIEQYTDEGTFLASEELTLETLEKYRMKTYKMIRHIDKMLVAYEWECNHGTVEDKRRCTVLMKRYIGDSRMSVPEIMQYLNIAQSTVYSDSKKAIKDMASMLFGYDAVMFR